LLLILLASEGRRRFGRTNLHVSLKMVTYEGGRLGATQPL
jgi:hypothetical protein